jgi:glycerophosphoryl diester phosphodiesterase
MKIHVLRFRRRTFCLSHVLLFLACFLPATAFCVELFPAKAWHRGDVSHAQENSRKAIIKALESSVPNIEVDVINFVDKEKGRVGLLVHDYEIERIGGSKGEFNRYKMLREIPKNSANPDLSPEPYMTVIELFELIREYKQKGIRPIVSLDLKEEGDNGKDFGLWLGRQIKAFGFENHVFVSSFFKNNVMGVKEACPECMAGGLVFDDHYALQFLSHQNTSLDLTTFSKFTFFLGFLGKETYSHDFVLIQDDIVFAHPEIIDYWKNERKVRFVGVFAYKKERTYTEEEWKILSKVDWLELDPPQISQVLQ